MSFLLPVSSICQQSNRLSPGDIDVDEYHTTHALAAARLTRKEKIKRGETKYARHYASMSAHQTECISAPAGDEETT